MSVSFGGLGKIAENAAKAAVPIVGTALTGAGSAAGGAILAAALPVVATVATVAAVGTGIAVLVDKYAIKK